MANYKGRIPVDPIDRFNKKYIVDEETGCWNWIGAKCQGYGVFKGSLSKNIYAHRFAYQYFNGPLDPNLEICHECNNKSCVNYNHLRQDTHSSNTIDKVKIKNQSNQKLNVEQVIEIKKALKNYYHGQCKDISILYNVQLAAISKIKNGDRWSHIQIP